jgi:hypothetical protein
MKTAINECNLQNIKEDVYKKLGFPEVDHPEDPSQKERISRTIMKTYLNHMVDGTWHHSILDIQKVHKEKLFKLQEGGEGPPPKDDPLVTYLSQKEQIEEVKQNLPNIPATEVDEN